MESIFLFCFAFGAIFALASTILGIFGAGLHGLGSHFHIGGGHTHGGAHGDGVHAYWLNPSAFLVGITTFGAFGYLGMHHLHLWGGLSLALAIVTGSGSHIAMAAMFRQLQGEAGTMLEGSYELQGIVATVTVGIPPQQAGEIIFELNGVRRSEAARSVNGNPISRGTQVVILNYDRGTAIVDMADELLPGGMKAIEEVSSRSDHTQNQAPENG